ncbi:hypothetical protein ACQVP2_12150 [Methylobacterium aquaticum]|uniref:hypothetical protein n=1 Tax=Methylobacterium aquaticum TaxID=270351 RepID=UPI003D16C3F3
MTEGMMERSTILAAGALVAAWSISPASAAEFHDPKTGFSLTVPAGFVLKSPRSDAKHDFLIGVVSLTGQPPTAGNEEAVCAVGFIRFAKGSVASQADLNAMPARQKMALDIRRTLPGQGMAPQVMQAIPSEAYAGFEIVSKPTLGPDHENVSIYTAIMDRVVGRTNVICVTTKQALPDAYPVFRVIRDGTRPPAE